MTPEPQDSEYRDALDRYFFLCRRFRVSPVFDHEGRYNPYGNHAAELEALAMREEISYAKEAEIQK